MKYAMPYLILGFLLVNLLTFSAGAFAQAAAVAPSTAPENAFHNEGEIGSTIVTGNTQGSTTNVGEKASYQFDGNTFKLNARYLRSTANGVESAKNWDGALRYERSLNSFVSVYAAYGLDSDIYSGYVQRNNYDVGGKYIFAQSKPTNWSAELGYRNSYTQFVHPSPDAQGNFIRIYSEITQALAQNSSFRFWFEFLPNVTDGNNYRYNFEPSVTIMLSDMFSLKAADLFKYQNVVPQQFTQKLDSFFTLSLVSKF